MLKAQNLQNLHAVSRLLSHIFEVDFGFQITGPWKQGCTAAVMIFPFILLHFGHAIPSPCPALYHAHVHKKEEMQLG